MKLLTLIIGSALCLSITAKAASSALEESIVEAETMAAANEPLPAAQADVVREAIMYDIYGKLLNCSGLGAYEGSINWMLSSEVEVRLLSSQPMIRLSLNGEEHETNLDVFTTSDLKNVKSFSYKYTKLTQIKINQGTLLEPKLVVVTHRKVTADFSCTVE